MVKVYVHKGPVQALSSKPLAGAVYKRQRRTAHTAPPQDTASGAGAKGPYRSAAKTREDHSRSLKEAASCQFRVVHGCSKAVARAQAPGHYSRPPLQPVPSNSAATKQLQAQSEQAAAQSDPPAWGLSHEAAYFAELDSEALLEDEHNPVGCQGQKQAMEAALGLDEAQQKARRVHTLMTKADLSGLSHSVSQTPAALELVRYHPELQAKYDEYVQCMESSHSRLTPMPLEDFCRLAGKECRGLPVLNT